MAKRPLLIAIVAAATVAVLVPMTVFGLPYGRFDPESFAHLYTLPGSRNQTHLHIDANPNNGTRPCAPIDATRKVRVGTTYKVALCLETYAPNSVESFKLRVLYSPINQATELETAGTMLDDNPDANDGDDPTGMKLGDGWDCSGFGVQPPVGDDPATLEKDALIACFGFFDTDLTANPGLLAMIEFTATGKGMEFLSWGSDTEIGGPDVALPNGGFARCGTGIPGQQIACFGATIDKTTSPFRTTTPPPPTFRRVVTLPGNICAILEEIAPSLAARYCNND